MDLTILKKIEIDVGKVFVDNKLDFQFASDEEFRISKFLKAVYKNYGIKYPKYFKMDNLSKLGFLSAEILLKDVDLSKHKVENIAQIYINSESTFETDEKFYETVKDPGNFYPSPSIFVYTLPNIMMGEISIRNGFKGENTFYVSEKFDKDFLFDSVKTLFNNSKTTLCLAGWIDLNGYDLHSEVYLTQKIRVL